MLKLTITVEESFDETTEEFIPQDVVVELEHSLASLSKWEEIWEKPFLTDKAKTPEEFFSYIACMVVTPDFPPEVLQKLSEENQVKILEYIDAKRTATWFRDERPQARSGETLTSELIYYWMSTCGIDWQAQNWHLNRLFTLIRVHSLKNAKPKPVNKLEEAERRRAENARRRAELGTKG